MDLITSLCSSSDTDRIFCYFCIAYSLLLLDIDQKRKKLPFSSQIYDLLQRLPQNVSSSSSSLSSGQNAHRVLLQFEFESHFICPRFVFEMLLEKNENVQKEPGDDTHFKKFNFKLRAFHYFVQSIVTILSRIFCQICRVWLTSISTTTTASAVAADLV